MEKSAWRTADLCSIFGTPLRCDRGSLMSPAGSARRPALNAVNIQSAPERGDTDQAGDASPSTATPPSQVSRQAAAMHVEPSPRLCRTQAA
jgi:hypothetical protein